MNVTPPQGAAESAAFELVKYQYGASFRQGHRTWWRDGIEWIIRSHRVSLKTQSSPSWSQSAAVMSMSKPLTVPSAATSEKGG